VAKAASENGWIAVKGGPGGGYIAGDKVPPSTN
jgi:hypothetical protein